MGELDIDPEAAEAEGNNGGGGEAPISPHKASMPLQLRRLPRARLNEIQVALAILEQAGFKELSDVGDLSGKLRGFLDTSCDGFPTAYTDMCAWAATRGKWSAAMEGSTASACSLESASAEDATRLLDELAEENKEATGKCEAELGNGVEAVDELRTALKKARPLPRWKEPGVGSSPNAREFFIGFAKAMLAASNEIVLMGVEDWKPRSFGAGKGVVFEMAPANATAPPPKPKKKLAEPSAPLPPAKPSRTQSVITVHVGGAGCGMGVALWERLFNEHRIDTGESDHGMISDTHFIENQSGRHVPRTVFMDFDPAGVADASAMGKISPEDIIEGSGGNGVTNWADFRFGHKDMVEAMEERVRSQMEKADRPTAIMTTHSIFGHTSALMDGLLERLSVSYGKMMKWSVVLAPPGDGEGDLGTAMAYHPVLGLHSMLEHNDLTTYVDNAALHKLASDKRGGLGLEEPTVKDYNRITARAVAAFTAPLRTGVMVSASDGMLRLCPRDAMTNLVPYPRIHFTVPSLAPLYSDSMAGFATDDSAAIVSKAFHGGKMALYDASDCKNLAVALYCRGGVGKSYIPSPSIQTFKADRRCQYVDFVPTGFAVGTHLDVSIAGVTGNLGPNNFETVALHNTGGLRSMYEKWAGRFDEAYSTRADVSNYVGCGMEEGQFSEGREDLASLIQDYGEVCADTATGEGEEEEDEY